MAEEIKYCSKCKYASLGMGGRFICTRRPAAINAINKKFNSYLFCVDVRNDEGDCGKNARYYKKNWFWWWNDWC